MFVTSIYLLRAYCLLILPRILHTLLMSLIVITKLGYQLLRRMPTLINSTDSLDDDCELMEFQVQLRSSFDLYLRWLYRMRKIFFFP